MGLQRLFRSEEALCPSFRVSDEFVSFPHWRKGPLLLSPGALGLSLFSQYTLDIEMCLAFVSFEIVMTVNIPLILFSCGFTSPRPLPPITRRS
jgi:hypothetical protein